MLNLHINRLFGPLIAPLSAALVTGLAALMLATSAWAVPVIGESDGTFTSTSKCISGFNCRISDTDNGEDTELSWGIGLLGTSSLTAEDVSINAQTDAYNVVIGQLTWTNTPIISLLGPSSFDAVWTLNVAFTEPQMSSDSEVFNLHIVNTPNPSSDIITGLTLQDLSNLSWSLGNVTVGGLHYVVEDGSFNQGTNTWTNAENNTSTLSIVGNFTTSPSAVPEPGTLILLGTGLAGVAAGAWRKRRRV